MEKGSLGAKFFDRTNPMDKHMELMMDLREFTGAPPTPQMFGNAAREHMERFGAWQRGVVGGAPRLSRHCVTDACNGLPRGHCAHGAVGTGTTKTHFAKIAYKNHKNSVNNPYSQVRVSARRGLAPPPPRPRHH